MGGVLMSDASGTPRVAVAVFAYNEERVIADCLAALLKDSDGVKVEVFVLINGCTDGTEGIVRGFASQDKRIHVIVIPVGDKANAWNHFVHEITPDCECAVFTDGDVRVRPGSLLAFAQCFSVRPEALALAGLPASGRNESSFRRKLIERREIAGNLYAIRGTTIKRLAAEGVRLPLGQFGEDGLVGTLLKCNLDPLKPIRDELIAPCEGAEFLFESLSVWRPADWRTYFNRNMRYAVRRWQAQMLYSRLFSRGLAGLPKTVEELYEEELTNCHLEWRGLSTIFDWLALRRIKRRVKLFDARYYS